MDRVSLIYKVLSGQASAAERNELAEWIGQSVENKAEFEDVKLLWASSKATGARDSDRFDEGFMKIRARIRAEIRRQNWVRSGIRTAVIVLSGLILFLLSHHFRPGASGAEGLRFNDVSLEDAIGIIEDKYNIVIEVDDTDLLTCRLTLILFRVDSAPEVVTSLAHSLNAEAALLSDKRYRLTGRGCKTPME
jgi:hypothetical protein